MPRQPVYVNQGLAGTERYGAVQGTEVAAILPAHIQSGTEPAPPSGKGYGIRSQCQASKDDGFQCGAPQKNGSKYCVGHTKKFANMLKEKEAAKAKVTPSDTQE